MINRRNVITMKIPFPDISSGLAVLSHMYICKDSTYKFFKVQTLKPNMLVSSPCGKYVDEKPDVARNPFKNTSRIDCDKLFSIQGVLIDDSLKTSPIDSICESLMQDIEQKNNTPAIISINSDDLIFLNRKITLL